MTIHKMPKSIETKTDKQLLVALDKERNKYSRSDTSKMQIIVKELVKRKVYPSERSSIMKKNNFKPLKMVEYYGAYWHVYKGTLICPHCNEDLRDLENGPPFKRELSMYNLEEDRSMDMVCPKCLKSLQDGKQYWFKRPKAKKLIKVIKK